MIGFLLVFSSHSRIFHSDGELTWFSSTRLSCVEDPFAQCSVQSKVWDPCALPWNLRQREALLGFKVFLFEVSDQNGQDRGHNLTRRPAFPLSILTIYIIKMHFCVQIQIRQDKIPQLTDTWFEIAGHRSLSINLTTKIIP